MVKMVSSNPDLDFQSHKSPPVFSFAKENADYFSGITCIY